MTRPVHQPNGEALRASEERFRATFEQAAVGIAHVARNGRFLRINRKFCDIVGYVQAQLLQRTFQDITHPDDLDADLQYVRQLIAGEIDTYTMEKRYVRQDSTIIWVNLTVSLVPQKNSEPSWFVSVIQDISARKQAEQAVLQYQRRLQSLASELTLTEERERRNIALDLHDQVGQNLAFMRIQLALAQKAAAGQQVAVILDEVSATLRQAIGDIRNVIADLSSPLVDELGLAAGLAEWLRQQVGERHGLVTRFNDDGEPKPLSDDTKAILFRSVRELLLNVVKHAAAQQVTVSLQRQGNTVNIVVQDDGIGLPAGRVPDKNISAGGFGLFSIEERLSDLGGSFTIESQPGQGVRVMLSAPLKGE